MTSVGHRGSPASCAADDGRAANAVDDHVEALAARQLSEKQHERPVPERVGRPEPAARGRVVEVADRDRVADHGHARGRHAQPQELLPLGVGHAHQAGRVLDHAGAVDRVEQPLGRTEPFEPGRRAVRCQHVGHAGASERTGRPRARQVPARVQVGHVEVSRMGRRVRPQPERQERLRAVREPVRQVRKHSHRYSAGSVRRPRPPAGAGRRREPIGRGRIGRPHGHGVAPRGLRAGQRRDDAGNAAVGPGVAVVRRDVQDPERSHGSANFPRRFDVELT